MATQDQPGIPFSISHKQQHMRLMEVPPELFDTLRRPNPPIFQLGSSDEGSSASPTAPASQAILTVGDKIFQIRQISTSNSVFLLHPTAIAGDDQGPGTVGVTAVATIGNTLELLPRASVSTTSRKWHDKFKKNTSIQ